MHNIGQYRKKSNNKKNVLNNLSKRRLINVVSNLFDFTDIFDIGQGNCHVKILRLHCILQIVYVKRSQSREIFGIWPYELLW